MQVKAKNPLFIRGINDKDYGATIPEIEGNEMDKNGIQKV